MKRFFKPAIAILLCAVMLVGMVPTAFAAQSDAKRAVIRLAELSELEAQYLSDSEARAAEYPNGAMMIVETSAELDMGKTYAIDIFRQGGVKGEASIKLSTVDLSAGYNEAYRLYLTDEWNENPVEGEKKLYYYETGIPYIAREGEEETKTLTQDNVDDLDEAKRDASEINDMSAQSMPRSTETVLTFAEGENRKTVYIETLKPEKVTDDLELMLTLSDPENCSISANTSGVYKITEEREKPAAKLEISSVGANPDDEEAFISVKRTGNLGGYDSFRVTTQSGTAKAEEDYKAVAMDLHFIPNQSEIKVPVTILDGAEDGESFTAELSDVNGNATAANTTAAVTFDSKKEGSEAVGAVNKKFVTDITYKTTNSSDRSYEFVDLSKMQYYTTTGSSSKATTTYDSGKPSYEVGYKVPAFGSGQTTYARSSSSIDLYGVNSAHVCYDIRSGSVRADTGVICFASSVSTSGDKGMSWRKSKANCDYNDLVDISSDHKKFDFNITDHSSGQYLWICTYRNACWGYAGFRVHDYNGNNDCCVRLNLQSYDVTIKDPGEVPMYVNGKLEMVKTVTGAKFTNPNDASGGTTNHTTFYRYDSTVISATVDSRYGKATFKGIYLLDPNDNNTRSSLITLSNGGQLTLTPEFLRTYSNYIKSNKIVIEPCYEFDPVNFTVESYEDKTTGMQFTADNDHHIGYIKVNGQDYGTVTWSADSSRNGKYYDGDEIKFTYNPTSYGMHDTVNYQYRCASVESDLKTADKITVSNEVKDNINVRLTNRYFSVTPIIVSKNAKTRLVVSNPDKGNFISKDTKYAEAGENGTVVVTGIKTDKIDQSFEDSTCGTRLDLTAQPDPDYYAVWKYTDAVTHQEVTRYGNTFHFVVQNPFFVNDNFVYLSFEKVEENLHKPLRGKITIPEGTVLHPATSASVKKTPAEGALIYMDGYVGRADKNGQFILKEDLNQSDYANLQLGGYKTNQRNYTQTNRAIVIYNSNTYVCDVTVKLTNAVKLCATTEITLDSNSTGGVVPTGVTAYSSEISGDYGSTITLVNTYPVSFRVSFDSRNVPAGKPVNLARWSFENDKGVEHSADEREIETGSTIAYYDVVLSEKAKQGDRMFIEFYNKTGDTRTSYGRFEVGYEFVNANIEKVVSYMPDQGFYDDPTEESSGGSVKLPSAPGIGPISPMFSLFGFTPIYSDKATGQKDKKSGKDLYCLEIGVQLSIAKKDTGSEEGNWDVTSVAKQYEKLSKLMDKQTTDPAQGMNTSTTISVSVTFAYQLEYYTADGGARHYTASVFLLGAKFGVKISIPFTIVVVPCFVYIDISVNNVGYLVHSPNEKTKGYWTANTLDNSYFYDTHGVFKQQFSLKFGVGVGYDGIASIGGHIDFNLDSTISGSNHGKMEFGIKGGVFAELVFFKVDYTWDIDKEVLLDTDAKATSVAANILRENSDDFIANTKLSDLTIARASERYDTSVVSDKAGDAVGADASATNVVDTYEETNAAEMVPVIGQVSENRYLIANAVDDEDSLVCLRCYVYDTQRQKVVEKLDPVCDFTDSESYNSLTAEEKRILSKSEDLVAGIDIVDCGDKLLLLWESCIVDYSENLTIPQFLQSFKVMGMLYDKTTGKFTDYSVISDGSGKLPDRISGVYNAETKTVHVFYESIDVNGITEETTLDEIGDRPLSLSTAGADVSGGKLSFTPAAPVQTNGNTVSDYSATSYEGNVLLSYICAEENSRILEQPLTETEGIENASQYGTKNRMYLNRYDVGESGALTELHSMMLADEEDVTANPEFVDINYQGVSNTLLFYKHNGRYGYQNVNNLYLLREFYNADDVADAPEYITMDEDHTVGEDFKVYYGGDGELYALWTLSEGDQQQIWGRQFEINSITDETEVAQIDGTGNAVVNADGATQTDELDEPVKILNGYWGNKVNLTTGGIKDAGGTGFYKGNFDAAVVDSNHLLGAYEAFDYDYSGEKMERINNRFLISEFDLKPYYTSGVEDEDDAIEFSDYYPTPGETVEVNVKAANIGFKNGHDVTLNLMSRVNGTVEKVDSVEYPVWLAGEDLEASFSYTVPEAITNGTVELYYEIVDDGESKYSCVPDKFRYAPKLSIEIGNADPENEFTDDNDAVRYHVTATIANVGNNDYSGGDELNFIFNDLAAQADVMNPDVPDTDPFYINYGGTEIPEIAVGSSVQLSFVSDDIPESIFDKYGTNTANLKLAVTPRDGIGWKEVKGNEPYNFLDELGIGQLVKPEPDEITEISADALEVPVGESKLLLPAVTPASAADTAQFSYSTEDNDIISVSEDGEVTALKTGSAVVTITCGDVSQDVEVTVTPAKGGIIGDVNGDGVVTIIDATLIQKYSIDLPVEGVFIDTLADVNGDGRISILDVTCIQKYVAEYTSGTGMTGQQIKV